MDNFRRGDDLDANVVDPINGDANQTPSRSAISSNWRVRDPQPESSERPDSSSKRQKWSRPDYQRESGPYPRKDSRDSRSDWGSRRSTPQDNETPIAVTEGRRIYLGNIFYHIRPEQISEAMKTEGFENIEQIHISVDPVTGRNPGYCFVEFDKRETAEAAISRMAGVEIEGRALHTGPCHPKKRSTPRRFQRDDERRQPTFERWGNWSGDGGERKENGQGPIGAEDHLVEVVETSPRSRVWVGGLDRMINQAENDEELRALFDGFKIAAVSKRITPTAAARDREGYNHYAFVDLESKAEADAAIRALNGLSWRGSQIKVQNVTYLPRKIAERGIRWGDRDRPSKAPPSSGV